MATKWRTAWRSRGCRTHQRRTKCGVYSQSRAVPHLDDPLFGRAREVIYWYFTKVPRLTAEVRMAEEEKLAAQGGGAR
jgi:hypothetical protein